MADVRRIFRQNDVTSELSRSEPERKVGDIIELEFCMNPGGGNNVNYCDYFTLMKPCFQPFQFILMSLLPFFLKKTRVEDLFSGLSYNLRPFYTAITSRDSLHFSFCRFCVQNLLFEGATKKYCET